MKMSDSYPGKNIEKIMIHVRPDLAPSLQRIMLKYNNNFESGVNYIEEYLRDLKLECNYHEIGEIKEYSEPETCDNADDSIISEDGVDSILRMVNLSSTLSSSDVSSISSESDLSSTKSSEGEYYIYSSSEDSICDDSTAIVASSAPGSMQNPSYKCLHCSIREDLVGSVAAALAQPKKRKRRLKGLRKLFCIYNNNRAD